jgi:hypothetical protein
VNKALSMFFVVAALRICCGGQEAAKLVDAPSFTATDGQEFSQPSSHSVANLPAPGVDSLVASRTSASAQAIGLQGKFSYYLAETYWNPSALTAPAFRAGLRMANPPGKGATKYPSDWRQGAEGFGKNYGDAFASRVSAHTAQFLTGAILREDPRYTPSASHEFFARGAHAVAFTFVDRSDSGRRMPASSNFAGAAAGGFVGNAYLPVGFQDKAHAGQRATFQFGMFAAGNLFREFAPQMPRGVQLFISLIAR